MRGCQSWIRDNCSCGGCVWLCLFEVREVARLANYLGIDPWLASLNIPPRLRVGSVGVTTQQYTQPIQPFLFPQTAGVLSYYSIASNIPNIHWHFNPVYHGELDNLMSDTLTQGNRSLT